MSEQLENLMTASRLHDERVVAATPPTLDEIMLAHGSDKASVASQDWQWPMDYCRRVYSPLLDPLRYGPVRLLELGWGEWDPDRRDHANPNVGGRSARAWSDYFAHPDSSVTVIEIHAKNFPDAAAYPRVHLYSDMDATDPVGVPNVARRHGPFDVIIDDASHVSSLTVASFKLLWPHLAPGGLYVVEDLHSSYHDYYFGKTEACRDPGAHGPTAVTFFKRLADEAFFNHERMKGPAVDGDPRSWDCYPKRYWMGYMVESVTFHAPQIIVVRKRA